MQIRLHTQIHTLQTGDPDGTGLLSLHAVKTMLKDLSFQVRATTYVLK